MDLDDEEGWRQANPALGIRITREAMARELRAVMGSIESAKPAEEGSKVDDLAARRAARRAAASGTE